MNLRSSSPHAASSANGRKMKQTQTINLTFFLSFEPKFPNVPSDTKLSNKTLRYAIRYIKYLIQLLEEGNDQSVVSVSQKTETQRKRGPNTGWPQYVWAMELRK